MTIIEKIIANHSKNDVVKPGIIVDVTIDSRVARDFGGANVIKNMQNHGLKIDDPQKTFFTFDCNPTGSDQKYAINQHKCRLYAREHGLKVYDIDQGIGTHILIQDGLAWPGSTTVTTDSHANILGAIGAFGQGMGDKDIASAWNSGKVWFKVPSTVKINLNGEWPENIRAKDIALNLLNHFGANKLLGCAVEIYGDAVTRFTLDERITISSMATEMGCIAILFEPNALVMDYCEERTGQKLDKIKADSNANYEHIYNLDFSSFKVMVSRPGAPHDTVPIAKLYGIKIDSAFIGSCTNGRIMDMRAAANVLAGRQIAPGVVLKIVPATDEVWQQCLTEGLIQVFKNAGAMLSNAGCAGCAAGQVGQNGKGEVTISTGNRNFVGKQGKGDVYLASPAVVAASAIAGIITTPDNIPDEPVFFKPEDWLDNDEARKTLAVKKKTDMPNVVEGRAWIVPEDNVDTDMIFHNRYLSITNINEMGQYAFDNLKGYEHFAKKVKQGDVVIVGKNFGSGSSRQQAVDCFKSLGVGAILAESFGSIYERNAINAAFPILTYRDIKSLGLENGNRVKVDFKLGELTNMEKNITLLIEPFSEVQWEIYQNGGLF